MNLPVAREIYATAAIRSNAQQDESWLRRIVAWLKPMLTSRRPQNSAGNQHQSFMDAHLLDDVMGPEISRTLRR